MLTIFDFSIEYQKAYGSLFINHFLGIMKNVSYITPGVFIFIFKRPHLRRSNRLLRYSQLVNNTTSFALFRSHIILLILSTVLRGRICKWLLEGNTDTARGLTY